MSPVHEQLIHKAQEALLREPDVIGMLLQGSLARGDGYPTSDVDLFVLLRQGAQRAFAAEERQGILVEQHASDGEHAAAKVRRNPMLAYGFVDGQVLRDDTGEVASLIQVAHSVIASYRTPLDEYKGILYWLQSARIKITAAANANDSLKASFIVATTSWKILEGVWAVNNLPMPPSGTVLAHKGDLTRVPDRWDERFAALFLGDTDERVDCALAIMDWLLETNDGTL